jgi:hypothetical protein
MATTFDAALSARLKEHFADDDLGAAREALASWLVTQFAQVAAEENARQQHEEDMRAQHKRLLIERIAGHPNFEKLKAEIEEKL